MRECINVLPHDGVTVTSKYVGAVLIANFNVNFSIVFSDNSLVYQLVNK